MSDSGPGLTTEQKARADALISVFENNTQVTQYDYHEVLGDGRGMTLGRGFTTASGDALLVVQVYSSRVPGNGLGTYIPILEQLAAEGIPSDDARLPSTLGDDWAATASGDPLFRTVQDEVAEARLLSHFAAGSIFQTLAHSHPTAGEAPTPGIRGAAAPDEENLAVAPDGDADAEIRPVGVAAGIGSHSRRG